MKIKTSYLFQDNEGAAFLRGAKDDVDALRMAREIWPNADCGSNPAMERNDLRQAERGLNS